MINIFKGLLAKIFGNDSAPQGMSEQRAEQKAAKIKLRTISRGIGRGLYRYSCKGFRDVYANTRSEARAKFKEQEQLLRMPVGVRIKKHA